MTGTDWIAELARLERGHRRGPSIPRAWPLLGDTAPPPLHEEEVEEAEAQLGITFPADYRHHLLWVSAGGRDLYALTRGPQGWGWYGNSETNHDLLTHPFPHPDSYRAYDDELGDREPPREGQAAWEMWDAECGVLQERKTAGAVFLREGGCGFRSLLVVTGPHRGEMWFDARATCDLLLPMRLGGRPATFADWAGRGFADLVDW
ncbi:SMI1/KNR4 family protein [Streptomyces sp. NPDC004788]